MERAMAWTLDSDVEVFGAKREGGGWLDGRRQSALR
jgi:hypothetical protein